MAEKISDNVGKKIVEALKMQGQPIEQEPISIEEESFEKEDLSDEVNSLEEAESEPAETEVQDKEPEFESSDKITIDVESLLNNNITKSDLDSVFQNTLNQNIPATGLSDVHADLEYPNNVAILTHLIAKLPAGVSKQTGALIIRQTMEALGISMKSVIREAKQVQEALASKARECQKNIVDYRKQIATLEIKGQQFQKQAVVMNDVINLFLSTSL